ncbi:MAG: bifunctional acetate--CoA ligase family protein/GNAT family N-acetyltransferase, partial [Gammaproteobacteria bacterium]|nr:bifunctional acetate--CoA ligase family protein/GNAT family N-acetyltransferase [Gammaproteobacteria bacterium]
CLDVDIGDVIDYLGSDAQTRSILLYMESLSGARKFMSAARAAARNKPLIIVKAGRMPEGARAAASHTGALAGSDVVYEAAIRRAGALRVRGIEDLFDTAELLGRARAVRGGRLTILTNGGGPGILATDAFTEGGGTLAELAPQTLEKLDALLPANWSRANPVDIIGDASPQRYADALGVLLADPDTDAVLIVHAPTAMAATPAIASTLAPIAAADHKPVLGCWLGGASAREAARSFATAGLPSFSSPEDAVAAFLRMLEYRANQAALMELPEALPGSSEIDGEAVRGIIAGARAEQRRWLSEVEAKQLFSAYGIPVVDTRSASDADDAARIAEEIGFPVALKVLSQDITHKSDVGGVVLDLGSAQAVREAAAGIARRVAQRPDTRLQGFSVQAMARREGAFELIIGASTDEVFGPVVLFGHGGTGVEVINDSALALPPLNMALARQLVDTTRVSRLLAGFRHHPAARVDLICEVLVRISRLVSDLEDIESLDINPLLADARGVVALDARVELRAADRPPRPELAISPYPATLEEYCEFDGERILLRPIRPEDEPAHREFFGSLGDEDIRFRFFGLMKVLEHSQLARYTQIDYDREMAFIACQGTPARTLGVVRAISDPDHMRAEFGIIVRSDIKGRGLGRILLEKLVRYCRARGIGELVGEVLQDNRRMLALSRELGFEIGPARQGVCEVRLRTGEAPAA